MSRLIVTLSLVLVVAVAMPAGPGYGVVLSAPQYGAKSELEQAYVVPSGYTVKVIENQPGIAAPAGPAVLAPAYGHTPHHTKEEEIALKHAYNRYLDRKIADKKGIIAALIGKAIEKTIDLKALLTQTTVDFITKVAVGTAANLAKTGVKATVHKVSQKYSPEYAYKKY